MRFYCGCYERFLFGFDVSADAEGALQLRKLACKPVHRSAVKCIDAAGNYVVTGGADDQIHLLNVNKDKDLGFLVNPAEGPVPCVKLFRPTDKQQPTHLLSGTIQGNIAVWRAQGDWELLKEMKGHKGCVNSISIHPSGKLALSVSRDQQMRLWDLVKGNCAYQAPIGAEGELVQFLHDGHQYVIAAGTSMTVHSTKGEQLTTLTHARRVLSCAVVSANVLISGCEGGDLHTWDIRKAEAGAVAVTKRAHASRIRGLAAFRADDSAAEMLASISSDGMVKVWDLSVLKEDSATAAAELDAGARFTCIAALNRACHASSGSMKRKADAI